MGKYNLILILQHSVGSQGSNAGGEALAFCVPTVNFIFIYSNTNRVALYVYKRLFMYKSSCTLLTGLNNSSKLI